MGGEVGRPRVGTLCDGLAHLVHGSVEIAATG
jgi:hypothetical protein